MPSSLALPWAHEEIELPDIAAARGSASAPDLSRARTPGYHLRHLRCRFRNVLSPGPRSAPRGRGDVTGGAGLRSITGLWPKLVRSPEASAYAPSGLSGGSFNTRVCLCLGVTRCLLARAHFET